MPITMPAEPTELVGETMYEMLQSALDEYGELMIRFDSGEVAELHKHNVEFVGAPMIQAAGMNEVHWFDAEKVESFWIHFEFAE